MWKFLRRLWSGQDEPERIRSLVAPFFREPKAFAWASSTSSAHGYSFERQFRQFADGRSETRLVGQTLVKAGADIWADCAAPPIPIGEAIRWATENQITQIENNPEQCRFAYLILATRDTVWAGNLNRIVILETPLEQVFCHVSGYRSLAEHKRLAEQHFAKEGQTKPD